MARTAIPRTKTERRTRRHNRVRKAVNGTTERPRLVVFRSLKHIYAQIVDDVTQKTLLTVGDHGMNGTKSGITKSNANNAAVIANSRG